MTAKTRNKRRATLQAVYRRPVPTNVRWLDVTAMLKAYGAELYPTGGSGVAVALKGRILVLHQPHPGTEMPRGMVKRLAKFLEELKLEP